jgi:hypothetical protein
VPWEQKKPTLSGQSGDVADAFSADIDWLLDQHMFPRE